MSLLPYVSFHLIKSSPGRTEMFASVGDVLVYCRPPRSVVGKIRCRVWNIRDQVHLGWVRDERVSRALDLCDKKPDFGGGEFLVLPLDVYRDFISLWS